MIRLYVPNASSANIAAFLNGRAIASAYAPSTFHTTGATAIAGMVVELDEPDERWDVIKPVVAELAVAVGAARIRVMFDNDDVSRLKGRLCSRSFWVRSDGTQEEV